MTILAISKVNHMWEQYSQNLDSILSYFRIGHDSRHKKGSRRLDKCRLWVPEASADGSTSFPETTLPFYLQVNLLYDPVGDGDIPRGEVRHDR